MLRRSKGFTLLELLIVVAIIGILAMIGVSQFLAHRRNTFNTVAITDMKNAKVHLESYFAENKIYPPD